MTNGGGVVHYLNAQNTNIPRNLKVCELCNDLGDEFHFLFICPRFSVARKEYIKKVSVQSQ